MSPHGWQLAGGASGLRVREEFCLLGLAALSLPWARSALAVCLHPCIPAAPPPSSACIVFPLCPWLFLHHHHHPEPQFPSSVWGIFRGFCGAGR